MGGGIRVIDETGPATPTELTATNSTISGNTADDQGGGVYSGAGGVLNFEHVTINDNGVVQQGGNAGSNVFVVEGRGDEATFDSTIVANGRNDVPNCNRAVTSAGNNLDTGESCGFDQASDVENGDPNLEPLADNGGSTRTHALPEGSDAIDEVDAGSCPDGPESDDSEDQRGATRPQDGDGNGTFLCDIGAYERDNQNGPPVAEDDGSEGPIAILEDEPDEDRRTIDVLLNDSDPNGDPLTVEITQGPSNGTAVEER